MSSSVTYLSQEARVRYANYALSVVTSRALPDVRDGLKPVQRRILFTMKHDLALNPDAKYRKSAKIVGDVMGNYHPHGDSAIYDAMVRMAQPWVMRTTLVDGQGNFGSPDDDAAAAYRYTEAKLKPIALELLDELGKQTVAWRPSYDGTKREPVVLPSRFPNLLVNGAQGIAVGMATSIPPHNLGEIVDACVAQIDAGRDNPLPMKVLLKHVKGPDFPTGATLQATREDLAAIYESGSGSLKLRGDYRLEEKKGGAIDLILTSVPYSVARKDVVEKVADIIINKKLPAMVDVRDESTTDVRIVIELKKGSDPQLVMAYLYKHTPLQTSVTINMTCLVPAEAPSIQGSGLVIEGSEEQPAVPERLGLQKMIQHFLDFRMETVRRRLVHDLDELRRRIHLLEGFDKIFDGVDEALKMIRKSQNKADARGKLMERFGLSELQATAVLEMQLYRLSHLEIQDIRNELDQRRAEAKRIEALLKSDAKRWDLIKGELMEIKAKYGEKRRTKVVGNTDEPEYSAEDFIAAEDANVILSVQGWIKRVRELKDLSTTRLREGDSPLVAVAGSTKHAVGFFSNFGACYVLRIHDVPPTTGHGEPVQKFFKLDDGERIIACMSFDPRVLALPEANEGGDPQPPYGLAVTRGGLSFRFPLVTHRDPSNKTGRRYARLNEGDEVVLVAAVGDRDGVVVAASDGVALGVKVSEVPVLSAAGKGSALLRLSEGERVVGAQVVVQKKDVVQIETEKGKTLEVTWAQIDGERGSAGQSLGKRDRFSKIVTPPPVTPSLNPN